MQKRAPAKRAEPVFIVGLEKSTTLGAIDEDAAKAVGCQHGPIKLEEGFGGPRGYGLAHLESNDRRDRQIRNLGFRTSRHFVCDICANWEVIAQGDGDRLIIARMVEGYSYYAVLQGKEHNGNFYWSVTTALPGRTIKEEAIIYRR